VTNTQEPSAPSLEIAHVLFVDIVAYSALHMDRQQKLLHDLQEAVRNTPAFNRAQADDQLIRLPTGDGMALVFFRDPEAPVRCALELTKTLCNHPDIKLRMGIHTGPVYRVADINANRNVAGGGINIAQRVTDCGDTGHILVSSAEADVLGQVSVWCSMLHDLGEVGVKHGVRVHIYNLYSAEAGNPAVPQKISSQRAAASLTAPASKTNKRLVLLVAAVIVVLGSVAARLFYIHNAHALSATDTIVLADFSNKTGEAIFDDTLRQGLAVQLEQSPFLRLISEGRIRQTLRLMGQPPDAPLTPQIARELCQRTGSKAYIAGSIASLGNNYVIGINAMTCAADDSLAHEQVQAAGKEKVLDALGRSATTLREKLGESLSSLKKFDAPLEATTSSLEALQAFSMGIRIQQTKGDPDAVPVLKRAIELDPNFALAYSALGMTYHNLGEHSLSAENLHNAYQLRDRVSEREKYQISAFHYTIATGEPEKAIQSYQSWAQSYPQDMVPRSNLGIIYAQLGQWDKAAAQRQDALRLAPNNAVAYAALAFDYLALNRFDDAKATLDQAQSHKLDSGLLRQVMYSLAFLNADIAGMDQQVAWAAARPGDEDTLLCMQSDTEAYHGRLRRARELSRRAIDSAARAGTIETAALWQVNAALREAEFGNVAAATYNVTAALALSGGRDVALVSALTLARVGDQTGAQSLAGKLEKNYPSNVFLKLYWLPTIKAAMQLNRGDLSGALTLLEPAAAYELGSAGAPLNNLYAAYLRGKAHLQAHNAAAAAVELQKLLDHRGIVQNFPTGALAYLELGRAYSMSGDVRKARSSYQDFLTLWKDADPDIPIFKQAKAEYAKLH
jgi:eukaryotic-like serine/threonine-protein kinase